MFYVTFEVTRIILYVKVITVIKQVKCRQPGIKCSLPRIGRVTTTPFFSPRIVSRTPSGVHARRDMNASQEDLEERPVRIGINGFGRIGRLVCRAARNRGLTTVAINDPLLGASYASFLLTHDTVMGRFEGEVSTSTERDDCFLIDGEPVHVTQRTDPGEVYIQTEIPRYRRKIS